MVTIGQLRKSRQREVVVGDWTFVVQLPTDLQFFRLLDETRDAGDLVLPARIAQEVVIDWRGVREVDLVPNAVDDPMPFDPEVYREWIADRSDLWGPIANAVFDLRKARQAAQGEAEKN